MNPMDALAHERLAATEMIEATALEDETVHVRFGLLEHADTGAGASSLFYLEVPQGRRTPSHTHSAEEIVVVLEGEAEGFVGEGRRRVGPGDSVVVPPHVWHGFENVGRETFRFLGFFASAVMVHEFGETLLPMETRTFVTPPLGEA